MFVASLFTIARTWKLSIFLSTDEWIKMCYIYTRECYSVITRNKFETILGRWMNLEPVLHRVNEVSQKENNKYHILTHIYGV